ncbi:FtsH protease activity modulator HflK [Parapusillimonas granuli]|uniref:Protein HflK n=1 Tax=Parapusillimonas granuli TaxID=380911 RepID=A0A853G1P8_9BURK|nr:FtsH protease activity modulator HflK [Parapusillimonas granuli]MEB2400651.1 FtsH protease activity modulator HflK [Alcaligenaceae bacterium]NYT50217.1 FtsH protease activity modulator HflK [Parapusillimonas granuli]
MRLMSKIFNLNDPGWGRGGNNGGSEPPRQPNKGDGPPDLDEVWRDFNNRLGALFGRKPRRGGNRYGGGGDGPGMGVPQLPKGSPKLVAVILVLLVGLWLASGFVIVQEGQVAVVTRFGQYTKTLSPGLQWRVPYPIEDHQTVNIAQLRTFEVGFRGNARNKVLPEALMLTTDENIVDLQYVVQYRLMPNGAPDYLFKTSQPDESVRQASETAMREIVGKKPMDFVLYSGRTEVATEVQRLAQSILDRYQTGIQISTVAIQNVQPPEQVQAAFDDAVKAGQDRERLINEGNAYSNKVLPEAQGQVARMLQEAEGYRAKIIGDAEGDTSRFSSIEAEFAKAPDITRERMYLSTMQDILQSTSKIMIDSEASNNMLYLPLDKIMRQAAGDQAGFSSSVESSAAAAAAAQQPSKPVTPARPPARSTAPGGSGGNSLLVSPYSR